MNYEQYYVCKDLKYPNKFSLISKLTLGRMQLAVLGFMKFAALLDIDNKK